ncbi:hypothetical protein V7100_29100 [Priestia megaterium]
MQKRKRLLFFCLVVLVLILSACGKSNDTDNAVLYVGLVIATWFKQ